MDLSINNLSKNEIIEKYTPLVTHIASRIMLERKKYMELEDLISYGYIGLIDAINKYDESKGVPFAAYAQIRIKGAILDEIRNSRIVSRTIVTKLIKYNNSVDKLQSKLMREPTAKEIAEEIGVKINEIHEIENYINYMSIISLESLLYSSNTETKSFEFLKDNNKSQDEVIEEKEQIKILTKCIDNLQERDKLILNLYYYENLTLKEIGKILNITESRVCQIHSKAITNLKNKLKEIKYIS